MRRNVVVALLLVGAVLLGWWEFQHTSGEKAGDVAEHVARAKAHPWFWGGPPPEHATPAPVSAAAGVRYHGLVFDAVTGAPLVAEVRLLHREEPLDAISTGPDGRFEFHSASQAEFVAAKADGYGVALHGVGDGINEIRLGLDPAVRISGRVIDEHSHPVAGATVYASDTEGFNWPKPQSAKSVTGADGRFVLSDAPAGGIELTASAAGYAEGRKKAGSLGPGRVVEDVEIVLVAGGSVAGRVLDAQGKPVANAPVIASRDGDQIPAAAITFIAPHPVHSGADGSYRIDDLAPGKFRLEVTQASLGFAFGETEVVAGRTASLDLTVAEENVVDGLVEDTSGRPIAGASLFMMPELSGAPGMGRSAFRFIPGSTDERGAFVLRGADYPEASLHVRAEGYEDREVEKVHLPAHGITVRLGNQGIVTGRILMADGTPWKGSSGRVSASSGRRSGDGSGGEVHDGTFHFGLDPGEFKVGFHDVEAGDSAPATVHVLGGQESHVELTLNPHAVVRGRLLSGGTPVPGAMVAISEASMMMGTSLDRSSASRSDAEGRFAVTLGSPDSTLFVYHPEYLSKLVHGLSPPGDGHDLDLGDITLQKGAGSAVVNESGATGVDFVDQDGKIVLDEPGPGTGAAEAGLMKGDQVLAVDGRPVAGMSAHQADELTNGMADTVVNITISRGGGSPTVVAVTRQATQTHMIMIMEGE